MWTMLTVIPVIKAIAWLLLSRLQGDKPHRGTLQNLPNPASGTYTNTHRNSGTFEPACLHQHTPELNGTFRNLPSLPPEPTPAYTGTLRNLPEASGTCLWNQHHFIAELSGTFRNLLPEATPAHTGTLRNLPEPSKTFRNHLSEPTPAYTRTLRNLPEPSGTCLRNLHQHTPEPSGTFRNLPPEPAPATRTGTHRSLSGLKTPVAYAVGEKTESMQLFSACGSLKPLAQPLADLSSTSLSEGLAEQKAAQHFLTTLRTSTAQL